MTKFIILFVFFAGTLLAGAGCSPTPELPTATAIPQVYPSPVTATPNTAAVPFRITRPTRVGDQTIKGTGPAGIPIVIANVTLMGNILGGASIGPDNHFEVTVPPLEANIRVGLEIGDLTGTGRTWEEFQGNEYKGDGAMLVPLVGYFQDTSIVGP